MGKKKSMKADAKTMRDLAERDSSDRLKQSKTKEVENIDSERADKLIRKNEGRKGNN